MPRTIPLLYLSVLFVSCNSNYRESADLIIVEHTHTFPDAPVIFKNKNGEDINVKQAGGRGINLGRLDFEFSKFSWKKLVKSAPISVTKKTGE